MNPHNPHLILMLKYPRPGEVKTRLVPALGERRACELYRAMVRHTLGEARLFVFHSGASLMARVAGAPSDEAVRQWLGDGISFQPQGDGDLGQRMERAMQEAFAEGASSAVVIGADCPELAAEHLDAAVRALQHNEAVLGPAADGGYYLIGLRRFLPELFRNIPWSTKSVLNETLAAASNAQVRWELLETLHDLDLPDDLPLWAQSQQARAIGKGKISIIVPAVNEAHELPRVLEAAQRAQPHEIIVVDGGSTDETVDIARSMDCIVLSTPRCRAAQMNRGASVATGEYLLFLHADTLLLADYATHVPSVLDKPGVAGGAFEFSIAGDFAGRQLVEFTTNWRALHWQMPYGDQALSLSPSDGERVSEGRVRGLIARCPTTRPARSIRRSPTCTPPPRGICAARSTTSRRRRCHPVRAVMASPAQTFDRRARELRQSPSTSLPQLAGLPPRHQPVNCFHELQDSGSRTRERARAPVRL